MKNLIYGSIVGILIAMIIGLIRDIRDLEKHLKFRTEALEASIANTDRAIELIKYWRNRAFGGA